MGANTVVKAIYANGDERTWVVEVENETDRKCYNAKATFTIPDGISLIGPAISGSTAISVEKGVYNPSTKVWYLGELLGHQIVESPFIFRVNDIDLVDPTNNYFEIKVVVESSCTDSDLCDNTAYLLLQPGGDCKPVDLAAGYDEADCCQDDADLAAG